jgi:hypothetical protein
MRPHYPDNPNFPEIEQQEIEGLGQIWTSKGVISLKNDRGTSYDMYIRVQNELALAFNELKDEMSMNRFGVRFTNLTDETRITAINKAVPMRISEAEPESIGD